MTPLETIQTGPDWPRLEPTRASEYNEERLKTYKLVSSGVGVMEQSDARRYYMSLSSAGNSGKREMRAEIVEVKVRGTTFPHLERA
jgi:hypothetical protein